MKKLKSIRGGIIIPCILFTILLLSVFLIAFSVLTSKEVVSSLTQSSSYNLELITNYINEDLKTVFNLIEKISSSATINQAFSLYDKKTFLEAFSELSKYVQSSSVYSLIDRVIIFNNDMTLFMQYGADTSTSYPLSIERLRKELPDNQNPALSISKSKLTFYDKDIIKFVLPLDSYSEKNRSFIYLALDAKELFKACFSYDMPLTNYIELKVGDNYYHTENNNSFLQLPTSEIPKENKGLSYSWLPERINAVKYHTGLKSYVAVTSIIDNFDISLSQIIPVEKFAFSSRQYWSIVLSMLLAVSVLGVLLWLSLNKVIYKPIKKLSEKLDEISKNDFSIDKSLETEDEFGDMGRKINTLSKSVVALMDERVRSEKHKQELEYKMLQNQINPHFIYNTLNTIKWMATIQKATGISEMTTSLSRMMKTISKGEGTMVPLEEELSFISEYITIMRYRYANTIDFITKVDPELLMAPIPRFTLQPILENAIFHGIAPKGKGSIIIEATRQNNLMSIIITDDGVGFDDTLILDRKSDGIFRSIGISNIEKRLGYIFNGKANIRIKSQLGVGTAVYITLPFEGGTNG